MRDKYIIIKEPFYLSIVRDVFSYGILFFLYYLNYTYLGDSTIIALMLSICFFIAAFAWMQRLTKSLTREEAIKKLTEMDGHK
jgi:hypothetical protein